MSHEELTIHIKDEAWLVTIGEPSDGIVALTAFPAKEKAPAESNIYWDIKARSFDEVPDELPTKLSTAIYQRMRAYPSRTQR